MVLRAGMLVALGGMIIGAQSAPQYQPARYRGGSVPPLPAQVVAGGQVILAATVSRTGTVQAIDRLRTTPPFTELVEATVRGWMFAPTVVAERARAGKPITRTPVASKVLIAAIYRPPALYGPTLGEPPRDVAPAADDCAYPLHLTEPPFPPHASSGGVALVEALVDESGKVAATSVVSSAPPFDEPAVAALKNWQFRPARVGGTPVATFVYVLFGFPSPMALAENHAGAGR